MFKEWSGRRKLRRMEQGGENRERLYQRKVERPRKANASRDHLDSVERSLDYEREIDNEIYAMKHTEYLQRVARRLLIAVPPNDASSDTWEYARQIGMWVLTYDARRALEVEIRAARQERWERRRQWSATVISGLPGLTGLIGAATGLATVLLHGCSH